MLVREQAAGPADAGLHFIKDEEQPPLSTKSADTLEVIRRCQVDPTLSLHRLQHDGARFPGGGAPQRVQVIERNGHEAGGKWLESVLVLWLSRGRQRPQGAPMEGVLGNNDLEAFAPAGPPPLPCQFDGRLVGLCTAVAEERPGKRGVGDEPPGKLSLLGYLVEVADMQQPRRLRANCCSQRRVIVAQDAHGDTRDEVEVDLSLYVRQPGPLPRGERNGRPAVCPHEILVAQLSYGLRIHSRLPSELQTAVYLVFLVYLVYLVYPPNSARERRIFLNTLEKETQLDT